MVFAKWIIEANIARLDTETKRKIAEAGARAAAVEADAKARVAKAEADAARAKTDVARQMLDDLRHRTSIVVPALTTGQRLQQEIENELRYVMQRLGATESSVLVKEPAPGSPYLLFLAAHGSSASQLQKVPVGPKFDCRNSFS